jgi:ABC-type branched-subunit amino acid transport system ATPase component
MRLCDGHRARRRPIARGRPDEARRNPAVIEAYLGH